VSQSKVDPIAIGYYAGHINQRPYTIAIGAIAANNTQPIGTVSLGHRAGADLRFSTGYSINLGLESGAPFGSGGISIGGICYGANGGIAFGTYSISGNLSTATGLYGISLGYQVARNGGTFADYFIGIGREVAFASAVGSWATSAIGIGNFSLRNGVPAYVIALGNGMFYTVNVASNHNGHIGIGYECGNTLSSNTTTNLILIGRRAGYNRPPNSAICIGYYAGKGGVTNAVQPYNNSIAIGSNAGFTGQGTNAIAIGYYAGEIGQSSHSIVINASSSKTVRAGNTGFFVNPIRATGGVAGGNSGANNLLTYNTDTSEITYSTELELFNLYLTGARGQIGGVNNVNNTNNNIFCNNLYALSAVYANNVALTSDYRIKENVRALDNNFKVDYLNPVTYTNKQTNKQDIGLIAHELQEHYPELVTGVKDGPETQSVNYIGLIPVLINEIKVFKNYLKNLKDKWNKEFA
jgi:hypothetical protein